MKEKGRISLLLRNLIITVSSSLLIFLFVLIIVNGNLQSSRQYASAARLDAFKSSTAEINALLNRCEYMLEDTFSIRQAFSEDESGLVYVPYDSGLVAMLESMESRVGNHLSIYAYVRGSRNIYSSAGSMEYSVFQQIFTRDYDPDQSRLFSSVMNARSPALLRIMHKEDVSRDQIMYLVPVSVTDRQEQSVIFLFSVSSDSLRSIFSSYLGESFGYAFIYPTDRVGLYYQSTNAPLSATELLKYSGTGVLSFRSRAKDYVMMRTLFGDRNIGIMLLDTSDHFYSDIQQNLATQTVFLYLTAVLLLVLAVVISFANAMPVRKLASQLTGVKKLSPKDNELEYLRMYHENISRENQILSLKLGQVRIFAASHLVRRLIFGTIHTREELEYMLSCTGVQFPHSQFCVFYIQPGTNSESESIDTSSLTLPEPTGIRMLPGDLVYENALAVMVNFSSALVPEDTLRSLASIWIGKLRQKGFVDPAIGIGSVSDNPLTLFESFSQASSAVRLRSPDSGNICFMTPRRNGEWQEEQLHSLIVESVRRIQPEAAIQYWKKLLTLLSETAESVQMFNFKINIFVQLFCKEMDLLGVSVSNQSIELLTSSGNTHDLLDIGSSVLATSCAKARDIAEQEQLELHRKVMHYIQVHYTEYELSIQKASGDLHMRPAQINDILRHDVGMFFVQYIAFLRMEEFKRKLLSENDTIQNMIHAVGYSDIPSFLRKFKQQEGMTPSEYKKSHAS